MITYDTVLELRAKWCNGESLDSEVIREIQHYLLLKKLSIPMLKSVPVGCPRLKSNLRYNLDIIQNVETFVNSL